MVCSSSYRGMLEVRPAPHPKHDPLSIQHVCSRDVFASAENSIMHLLLYVDLSQTRGIDALRGWHSARGRWWSDAGNGDDAVGMLMGTSMVGVWDSVL